MKAISEELEKLHSQYSQLFKEWEEVMHAPGYSGQMRREIVLANINTVKVQINKLELGDDYKVVYPQSLMQLESILLNLVKANSSPLEQFQIRPNENVQIDMTKRYCFSEAMEYFKSKYPNWKIFETDEILKPMFFNLSDD